MCDLGIVYDNKLNQLPSEVLDITHLTVNVPTNHYIHSITALTGILIIILKSNHFSNHP